MGFYRASKEIDFGDKKVTIYEINVESLLKLTRGEYKTNEEIILNNSDISEEDFKNMSIEAWGKIQEEFFKLNSKHFETKAGEKVDEGK